MTRCRALPGLLFLFCLGQQASSQELSLDQAVEHALIANHDYLNLMDQTSFAELEYDAAASVFKTHYGAATSSDARLGAETGSYYSFFMDKKNESGSGYRAGIYNSTFGDNSLSEIRFSYTLPFFKNPLDSQRLRVDQAEIELAAKRRMIDLGREELIDRVVNSYYGVLLNEHNYTLMQARFTITEKQQEARQLMVNHGDLSDLELARGELALSKAEQDIHVRKFQIQQSKDDFKLLIGLPFDTPVTLKPLVNSKVDDTLLTMPLGDLEELAMRHRIELVAKREQLTMVEKKMRTVRPSVIPPVEVSLQYSLIGDGESLNESFKFKDQRVGIGFKMNTDFGTSDQQRKQHRITLRYQAELRNLEQMENRIKMRIRRVHFEVKQGLRNIEISNRTLQLTERRLAQSQILQKKGELSQLDLIEVEMELAEARYQTLVSQAGYLTAAQQLAKVTGQYVRQWRY